MVSKTMRVVLSLLKKVAFNKSISFAKNRKRKLVLLTLLIGIHHGESRVIRLSDAA